MSIKDGGEFWKEVAQRLNEVDGTRFDVLRRAPATLNNRPRRNPAVRVVATRPATGAIVKSSRRVSRRVRR